MKKYNLLMLLISLILGACIQPASPPTPWPTLEPVLFEPNGLPIPPVPTPRPTIPPPNRDDPNYVKPTEHYPTDVTWNQKHDFLYLQGGLTQAGRIQLKRGQNSYFLIDLKHEPDEMLITKMKTLGIESIYSKNDKIGRSFVTPVNSAVLPFLEELEAEGLLNFAGPYPPRFKTTEAFEEKLATLPLTETIRIKIGLRDYPTDAEHAEIVHLLDIRTDTRNNLKTREEAEAFAQKFHTDLSFYTITGYIEVQYIPIILNIPIVKEVSHVSGSPF